MKKENILITGGAGYIGSHVNLRLQEAGYKTVILDNLSRGQRQAVIQGTFISGDLADQELLDSLFAEQKFQAVIHFAAFIEVGESVKSPAEYYRNNVVNSINLLDAMQRHGVEQLVFSSTAAIYGSPECSLIPESHPLHPENPYGRTKLIIEELLKDYIQSYNLRYLALRYFNAAGYDPKRRLRYSQKEESHLIPRALKALKAGNAFPLTIFGTDYNTPDGTCIRDYVHVWDLAEAHRLALEHLLKGASSSCYNLGSGQGFSVREVISAITKVTGKKLSIKEGGRRPGDPPYLVADVSKAKRELRWTPQYSDLETIIADAWQAILADTEHSF